MVGRYYFIFIVTLLSFFSINANAQEKHAFSFTGRFEGSGRACFGDLLIGDKTIAWITPFQICKRVPYKIIQADYSKGKEHFVFLRKQSLKNCNIKVIELQRVKGERYAWDATGYASMADFKNQSTDSLGCSVWSSIY